MDTEMAKNGGPWHSRACSTPRLSERMGMKTARWIRGFVPRFLGLRWRGRRGGAAGGLVFGRGALICRRCATEASAAVRFVEENEGARERERVVRSEGNRGVPWSAYLLRCKEGGGHGGVDMAQGARQQRREKHGKGARWQRSGMEESFLLRSKEEGGHGGVLDRRPRREEHGVHAVRHWSYRRSTKLLQKGPCNSFCNHN